MAAEVRVENEHPLIGAVQELQAALTCMADKLQEPVTAAISEAEGELKAATARVHELEAEFADLRQELVINRIPRTKLTNVRKALRAAQELEGDLEAGLASAYRVASQRVGAKLISPQMQLSKKASLVRDLRGMIIAKREQDMTTPHWQLTNAQSEINGLLTMLDELRAEAGRLDKNLAVDTGILAAAESVRKQLAMISREIEITAAAA